MMKHMPEVTTIYDVAQRAEVSVSTVSRVLNGSRRVAHETRRRVVEAIDELGYRPNEAAQELAARRARNELGGFPPPDLQYEGSWPEDERAAITRAILQRERRSVAAGGDGREGGRVRWLCRVGCVQGARVYAAVRLQDTFESFLATTSGELVRHLRCPDERRCVA